jgi:hypothetical protein
MKTVERTYGLNKTKRRGLHTGNFQFLISELFDGARWLHPGIVLVNNAVNESCDDLPHVAGCNADGAGVYLSAKSEVAIAGMQRLSCASGLVTHAR